MDKNLKRKILEKLDGLDIPCCKKSFVKALLAVGDVNHGLVCDHSARIALLAEEAAKELKLDVKAAFLGGLLHDVGKFVIDPELFSGRNVNMEEYGKIKEHVNHALPVLSNEMLFTALIASLHHNLYKNGYGLQTSDCPVSLSPATWSKVLDIAYLVSICDHAEAATHRTTTQIGGSGKSLEEELEEKYPDKHLFVGVILKLAKRRKWF